MSTVGKLARLGCDDLAFQEGLHRPGPVIAPTIYFDEISESDTEENSLAAGFARLLKICTHQIDGRLFPKEELALRITALTYLLDAGAVSIDQMAFEAGLKRSTLWRRIRLVSSRTELPIPHRKKARSASTERALKNSVNHVRDGITDEP